MTRGASSDLAVSLLLAAALLAGNGCAEPESEARGGVAQDVTKVVGGIEPQQGEGEQVKKSGVSGAQAGRDIPTLADTAPPGLPRPPDSTSATPPFGTESLSTAELSASDSPAAPAPPAAADSTRAGEAGE
jgi:hypothetical protein